MGDAAQIGEAMLPQHGCEAIGRAFGMGGDGGMAPGFALAVDILAHGIEQVEVRVGALCGEIFGRPRARIECVGLLFRSGERR